MQLNGAEILIECLKEQGVDTVFGYPGGAILNVYDELYKHSNEIRHILTSHEQGASHAADGYARATGKVGVCFATSGPGATNLVTGIATAFMDSIPIVAITCNVGVPLLGKDSFQEIDITGITMPITKYNFIVKNVNDLAKTIRKAFEIAQSGRPGPVLIDIPKDVTGNKAEYEPVKIQPIVKYKKEICMEDINKAVEMIEEAKRPFVFVGGGAILSDASEELRAFVDKVQCPVCDSLMGKGAFPGTDELYTGMLGMHGTKTSNFGVSECDLLIVVGARFSDRVTGNPNKFASNAKILQFDIDVAEMNKNVIIDEGVVGDIKEVLAAVNEKLSQQEHTEWIKKIQEYKAKYPLTYHPESLTGPYVIEEIYKQTEGDAIIVTEVGQHQMWAAQYYKFTKPRTLLTSGGLGTMGYGLGAAIGADFLLAVGGGSSIDTAKAIAHGVANPDWSLEEIWGGEITLTRSTPVGCVLTIAAAGSETSDSAVLTNEETGKKGGISTSLNRPKFAVMNPVLTYTLPKYQIACGIVDIMMHTLERYFIPNTRNQMTDEIAEGLLRVVIENGKKGLENPTDYDAMSEIMWAGSLSHNGLTGLGRAKDFSVHKLGHALGAKYDKAHGATLSAVWGSWAEYVYKNDEERFAHYAKKVWGVEEEDAAKAAKEGICRTVEYFREIHMPTNLKELEIGEVSEEDLRELAMAATLNDTVKLSKIKELTAEDVYQIFRKAAGK